MPAVYDKAAKSLADNLNSFIKANGDSGFYKTIEVSFANEKSQSIRQYKYENSFCNPSPCSLELSIGKGRTLIIQ